MGVEKKKRGRPKGSTNSQKQDVMKVVVEILQNQQKIMEENSRVMGLWMQMFNPPSNGPHKSSSLEERERMIAGDDEWEPVKNQHMWEILNELNKEEQEYRDQMVNT